MLSTPAGAYGTYPRILGRYVRAQRVIPLEDAIRKATPAVANRLGIRDPGMLREAMYADIAVCDPGTILVRQRSPSRTIFRPA